MLAGLRRCELALPNSAELIREQRFFQEPRGIEHNAITVFRRFMDEVDELEEELLKEGDMWALVELADVFIMAGAVAVYLIDKMDLEPEDMDFMIEAKMRQNQIKYPEQLFINHTPEEAVRIAREQWDNTVPIIDPDQQ